MYKIVCLFRQWLLRYVFLPTVKVVYCWLFKITPEKQLLKPKGSSWGAFFKFVRLHRRYCGYLGLVINVRGCESITLFGGWLSIFRWGTTVGVTVLCEFPVHRLQVLITFYLIKASTLYSLCVQRVRVRIARDLIGNNWYFSRHGEKPRLLTQPKERIINIFLLPWLPV